MENQLPNINNMSVNDISLMSNVKEVSQGSKNYLHAVILAGMIIFAILIVGLSVVNFGGFVKTQEVKVTHAQNTHSQDVQKLTNQ